jgi:hypothetical protein
MIVALAISKLLMPAALTLLDYQEFNKIYFKNKKINYS